MTGFNVKNGTGAGRRRVRVLPDWECRCLIVPATARITRDLIPVVQRGTTYSCAGCGMRRPS